MVILVESQNAAQQSPSEADLMSYANGKGFHGPVLADPGYAFGQLLEQDGYIPTDVLIGKGLRVIKTDSWVMPGDIDQALNE